MTTETSTTSITAEERGRVAFAAGEMRIVPRSILVDEGVKAAREWYRGWDGANAAAWVDELS